MIDWFNKAFITFFFPLCWQLGLFENNHGYSFLPDFHPFIIQCPKHTLQETVFS